MHFVFWLDPQAPGGGHPSALASSHKLGRPVGLASPAARDQHTLAELRQVRAGGGPARAEAQSKTQLAEGHLHARPQGPAGAQ